MLTLHYTHRLALSLGNTFDLTQWLELDWEVYELYSAVEQAPAERRKECRIGDV